MYAQYHEANWFDLQNQIGSLEIGKKADFIAVDFGEVEMTPVYSVISHLVYSASRENVSDVWVDGHRILKSRQLITLDYNKILKKARKWSQEISSFIHSRAEQALSL